MSNPPPFQDPTNPLIYLFVGFLAALVVLLGILYFKEKNSDKGSEDESFEELRTDNIGLSKKSEDLLNQVMENPELQSDLPDRLDVSKATVSNAVSELFERDLIRKKKKANTYLIEPHKKELEKQQR